MRVFLVGYMGCGKSTKAKQLSAIWNCPVIDLDQVIVEQQGKSIVDIFAAVGEEGFRKIENETLKNFNYPKTCVVACGGGLPCFYDSMQWMNQHGVTVYLKMTPPQLVSRLGKREKRPLIAGMDDEQLLAFIIEKLQFREPFYEQAGITVDAFDLNGQKLGEILAGKDQP